MTPITAGLDAHAIFVLLLTTGAIVLFAQERLPLSTSALLILVLLVIVFTLFPYEADAGPLRPSSLFLGFGHEALVSIASLMIMGRALERTGALQPVAFGMARFWPRFPKLSLLITLVVGAALRAFVNNTPIVVILLPMLVAVCISTNSKTSGVLLPMGLATIVGGMSTTIGTSTNLLVVAIARDLGLRTFSMFDFALPVVMAGSLGILFLWLIAPRILPIRHPPMEDTSPRLFRASLQVEADGPIDGKTFGEALALTNHQMRVDRIERGDDIELTRLPTVLLRAGDRLIVRDNPHRLKEYQDQLGLALQNASGSNESDFQSSEKLAEIVVTSGSPLDNRTLADSRFDVRYELTPVAIHHASLESGIAAN